MHEPELILIKFSYLVKCLYTAKNTALWVVVVT